MKHAWIPAALCGLGLTLGAAERLLIEDFSDVGTWRSNPVRNTTPGKWFGVDVYLGATPDASRDDGYAGKLLFHFADASKAGQVDFLRAKAGQPEVFADGVEFDINPRGISGSLRFTLEDSQGKRFMTSPAEFSGEGWRRCRAEVGKAAEGFTGPFKLYKIHFEAKGVSGSNYVLVDDFALTGDVSRRRTVSIRPVVSSLAGQAGQGVLPFPQRFGEGAGGQGRLPAVRLGREGAAEPLVPGFAQTVRQHGARRRTAAARNRQL